MRRPVLAVHPNTDESRTSWITSVDGQMTSSVTSLRDAVERADRLGLSIHVSDEAYDQMVQRGVAPSDKPQSPFEVLTDEGR
jgi:hypothetical protein